MAPGTPHMVPFVGLVVLYEGILEPYLGLSVPSEGCLELYMVFWYHMGGSWTHIWEFLVPYEGILDP